MTTHLKILTALLFATAAVACTSGTPRDTDQYLPIAPHESDGLVSPASNAGSGSDIRQVPDYAPEPGIPQH